MSRYKAANSSIKSHLSTTSLPKEEVNIVLLGKQNVGKSALVVKYLTKRFIREYDPFLGKNNTYCFLLIKQNNFSINDFLIVLIFEFLEDTYWKPDVVDQQEVLVKVMDTYGKV